MNERLVLALGQLDRQMAFFSRVEGKGSFLAAIDLGMLTVTAVNFPIKTPSPLTTFGALLAAMLTVVSLYQVYRIFFPDLQGGPTRSLLFFGDIAKETAASYRTKLGAVDDDALFEDVCCQIWRNAQILNHKFARMRAGFLFTAAGLPPWLTFLAATAQTGAAIKFGVG